jgi:hypothetical protein
MMVISYNSSRYEIVMDGLFANLLHILSRSLISVAAMLQFHPTGKILAFKAIFFKKNAKL